MMWVSVKEAMPEDMEFVVVDGGIAYYRAGEGRWYSITALDWPGKIIRWDVTHWAKLPKLDKARSSK